MIIWLCRKARPALQGRICFLQHLIVIPARFIRNDNGNPAGRQDQPCRAYFLGAKHSLDSDLMCRLQQARDSPPCHAFTYWPWAAPKIWPATKKTCQTKHTKHVSLVEVHFAFVPRVRIAHATQPGRLATFTKPTRAIASAKRKIHNWGNQSINQPIDQSINQ